MLREKAWGADIDGGRGRVQAPVDTRVETFRLCVGLIVVGWATLRILQQVSGTYSDAGMTELTLFDGTTVTAYKLTNNSLIISDSGFGTSEQDIYIEQYWVKGLGMVKETFEDQTEGTILMTKELSAYSGLTPE